MYRLSRSVVRSVGSGHLRHYWVQDLLDLTKDQVDRLLSVYLKFKKKCVSN